LVSGDRGYQQEHHPVYENIIKAGFPFIDFVQALAQKTGVTLNCF